MVLRPIGNDSWQWWKWCAVMLQWHAKTTGDATMVGHAGNDHPVKLGLFSDMLGPVIGMLLRLQGSRSFCYDRLAAMLKPHPTMLKPGGGARRVVGPCDGFGKQRPTMKGKLRLMMKGKLRSISDRWDLLNANLSKDDRRRCSGRFHYTLWNIWKERN